jgi:glycosyltransferase involved in cell wall biosynthesis
MNILLLATGIKRDAKEATSITTTLLANYLKRQGHKPIILSEQVKSTPKRETIEGITVYRAYQIKTFHAFYPIRILNAFLPHAKMIRDIEKRERLRFDIIHSFSSAPILALRSLLSFTSAKKVHTLKSWSREKGGTRFISTLNHIDAVTVPTKAMKKHFSKAKTKVSLIHSPIDLKRYQPRDKEALKRKYGFTGKKVILNYGGFWYNKGSDLIFDTMPIVLEKVPDAHYVFIPRNIDYYLRDEMAKAKMNAVEKAITVIDKRVKVEEWVAMADVLVLPYRTLVSTESNPSCLIEGMASNTQVITSDIMELKEIAQPDEHVIMTKPGDYHAIAKEIIKTLNKPNKTMLSKALKQSRQFDIEVVGKKMLGLYGSL